MPITNPILIDPTDFAHAHDAGGNQPNPYLFVKNGFLYEVLIDFAVPQLGVWKSALDGSGRVRCDPAHEPPAGTSPWDGGNNQFFAYSRQDSTKIGIAFATSNAGVTARIIKFVEFDTSNDQYGTYSPELNVNDRLGDGGALFQKANGKWYLVLSAVIGGNPRLAYFTYSPGSWSAATEMRGPSDPNVSVVWSYAFDESSGHSCYYFFEIASGFMAFIQMDDSNVVSGYHQFTDGIGGDNTGGFFESRIISGQLCSVMAGFDSGDGSPRVRYLVASPLPTPTTFTLTEIYANADNSLLATFPALAISNGASIIAETDIALRTGSDPPFDAGLLLLTSFAAPNGAPMAFWLLIDGASPPVIQQVLGSYLVAGAWAAATLIYDAVANPPAGYDVAVNSGGSLGCLNIVVGAPPPAVGGYISGKGGLMLG